MNMICRPKRTAISVAIAAALASGWSASYAGTTNGDPTLGDGAIANGNGTQALGDYSVALGNGERALGRNSLAIGVGGTAADVNAIAIGTAAVAQANAVALGSGSTAAATAIALGANSSATALAAIALGQGAGAINAGDVAIGAGSVTTAARAAPHVTVAGRTYDLAGSAPASVVSVGTVGAERQLTNVAAGTISAASTDAVNGSELYAAYQAIEATSTYAASLSTGVAANGSALTALSTSLAAGTIGLVQQAGGAPGAGTITIGATTGGTVVDVAGTAGARQIKGVAGGSDATDAVNVQQLQQLATAVGAIGANAVSYDDASHARVTLGTPAAGTPVALTNVADALLTSASTDAVSGRQLYATNQTLAGLQTGIAAGTVGLVQQAGGAPGAGTITIGATTGGTVVDVSGTDGARRITGVAAGRDATDAVNVAQLNQLAGAVNTVASNAVSYDDPARVSVTLGGLHATSSVLLRNVASGALSATSTDATNGAQLFATNQAVQANTNAITELASHVGRIQASVPSQPVPGLQGNLKYVSVNSSSTAAAASGTEAVAVGGNTLASGTGSTAIGSSAHVSGNGSVAIGSNATAPANNAVALGPGALAERDNTVSFGNTATGLTRTLSNVSAGVSPTDAVNVQQLNDSLGSIRNQIEHDRRDANGGTASAVAIASLPQAPSPGTSVVAIGGGSYAGQSAMAVGLSTYAGRWIFKASGSTNTRGTVAAGVGAGYAW
ncbi:hypothetical protein DF117_27775 [Burkholderia stagnalis]|uniref:YadA family autotransporter adhesin n=1 Tax=Burkholderia stagnalis TaxID=1503054 RepID=UPI000F5F131D|nr:YadA family autotransporter adhesin [Burkholderia stagnalis]RQY14921.1 hypothetical protein DF117_27775 [Burkholderia stagnalis]